VLEPKAITFNDLLFVPFEFGKMDCWALSREVFSRFGVSVPDYSPAGQAVEAENYKLNVYSREMGNGLVSWTEIENPEVPCLVTLGTAGIIHHVGVYIGNNKFIHVSRKTIYPVIERMDNPKYVTRRFYKYNSN